MASMMLFITIALCAAQSTMAESEKDRMTLMRTEREAGVALHMNAMGQMTKENVKDRRNSYCMIDFTLGVKDPAPGQHECYSGPSQASFDAETAEESHETTYNASSEEYDRARCTIAAARAGAHQSQHFMLHQQREDCHPRGCFVSKCDAVLNTSTSGGVANDEWCYFYNPISKDPDPSLEPSICGYDANKPTTHNLKGQAVCERKRFLFGKTGTVKHCPDGYTTISNSTDAGKADSSTLGHGAEQMCHSVVGCLALKDGCAVSGQCRADIKEASEHDRFPKGCFLDLSNVAYYNQELPEYKDNHPDPLGCCGNAADEQKPFCDTVCKAGTRTARCWDSSSNEPCGDASAASGQVKSYAKGRPICIVKDVVNWQRDKDTGLPASFFTTAAPSSR